MHGRAYKEYIFRSYNTSTFNALLFNINPFTRQCGKEGKKAWGFEILHFYWWFSSDMMTVKGLRFKHQTTEDRPTCLFDSFEMAFSTERVVTLCSFQLFASPDRRILLNQCFLIFPDGHVIVLFVENCIPVLNGKLYIYIYIYMYVCVCVPDKWQYG